MSINRKFTRRDFFEIGGIAAFGLIAARQSSSQSKKTSKEMLLYVGTYTTSGSEGIYIFTLNTITGQLNKIHTIKDVVEPSFLAIGKSRKYLYAVNETETYEGKQSGAVSAFAIDQKTGSLEFLNKQPSMGGAPCHISTSDNEKFVLVANYFGGNVTVFPTEDSGKLGEPVEVIQHSGSGPDKERQSSPHPHSIILSKDNQFAFVADLGADKVFIYQFDDRTGKLKPNPSQNYYQTKAGAGPRHFKFHPNGKLAFLINELNSTITSFAFDKRKGTLKEMQTVLTLPVSFSGANSCADIHIAPNGKFLYGSNRGHDSLVIYAVEQRTGEMKYVGHVSTEGKKPRTFAISPDGKTLIAANQSSDSIIVFSFNEKTGMLKQTKNSAKVSMPVCLKLIPLFV
jgi:6-phosphogluconolactonase